MFERFIQIRRLGKFRDHNASGDCSFRNFNLIYAENGMGKTTLTSILRSIKENNPSILFQRKNVNETEQPSIQLRAFDNNYNFDGTNWSDNISDIEIFDSSFVNQNVFSGDIVQLENKRNLYHLVVGEVGVELANQVNQLDSQIRTLSQSINNTSNQLRNNIIGELDIPTFIALQEVDDINQRIEEKEAELKVAQNADSIVRQSNLHQITFPAIELGTIEALLTSSIDTISNETEVRVKEHIAENLDENGELWIEEGLSFPESTNCPFCNQNIEANTLIQLYNDYFSEEYKLFKSSLLHQISSLKSEFSANIIGHIRSTYEGNSALKIFWEKFIPADLPSLEIENAIGDIENLNEMLIRVLANKSANPLDSIALPDELNDSFTAYSSTLQLIDEYNQVVNETNVLINEKKNDSRTTNSDMILEDLNRLKNVRARYTDEVNTMCESYTRDTQQKEALENEKSTTKERLDQETQDTFTQYQTAINDYLERFNVNFRIANSTKSYSGGKPSIKYFISLETHSFDPSNSAEDNVCFQSALSDGDKSSLAFAFFLARLSLETDLANKIIVFDDPINSLGDHRRRCTVQEILRLSPLCLQTIVLSHDAYFLRELYERIPRITAQYKLFKIQRGGNGVNLINDWNIERETSGRYFENYNTLVDYLAGIQTDNLRMVAMCIRPLLEGNLRLRFPTQFPRNEWLGGFIGNIRNANEGEELYFLAGIYDELDAINDYSQNFHHDQNPNADTMDVNDTELQGYVRRTLSILPGILNAG